MSGMQAKVREHPQETCGFCGKVLGDGFHYTCHLCGATYCYIHMPARCSHRKLTPEPRLRA
jgi:hypothetical protein